MGACREALIGCSLGTGAVPVSLAANAPDYARPLGFEALPLPIAFQRAGMR